MKRKLQFDFDTQQLVLQKIAAIESFKGTWDLAQKMDKAVLKELRSLATVQSTGSSTRIEGATLTDEEIKLLLKNMQVTKLHSRDEQEVAGYYEVLNTVLDSFAEIPLTENFIKQLHGMLLRHSAKDQRHRGEYKNLSNQVVATSPGGTQQVIFKTTLPHLTPGEMTALLDWTSLQFEEKKIHPLLVVGTFVYEFLSIHPFQDGNGRLSRLLTTLLLLRNGYDFVKYVSFENYIEEYKSSYYTALTDGQKNRGEEAENIEKWTVFFLTGLEAIIHRLNEKRKLYAGISSMVSDRQQRILDLLSANRAMQVSELQFHFPDISLSTLKNELKTMTDKRLIVRVGEGRGVRYFKPEV